jgi:acyl-coenzyme A synthetase/AMP-(fatty) acid ligase
VAILSPSDLDSIVTIFALSRLGYTVLLLSPRLAPLAIIALLKETKCSTILYPHDAAKIISTISQVENTHEVDQFQSYTLVQRSEYGTPSKEPRFVREVDKQTERSKIAIICHSSGSTGLPKPIYQPHDRFALRSPPGKGNRDFSTFPWYHSWGQKLAINAMFLRRTIYLYSAASPMTAEGLVSVLETVKPDVMHAVPYVLKLLTEGAGGIAALRGVGEVIFTGSQCPERLGDFLVEEGVRLGTVFGA